MKGVGYLMHAARDGLVGGVGYLVHSASAGSVWGLGHLVHAPRGGPMGAVGWVSIFEGLHFEILKLETSSNVQKHMVFCVARIPAYANRN